MRAHIDLFVEFYDHEKVDTQLGNMSGLILGPSYVLWVDLPPDEACEYLQVLSEKASKLQDEIRAKQSEADR